MATKKGRPKKTEVEVKTDEMEVLKHIVSPKITTIEDLIPYVEFKLKRVRGKYRESHGKQVPFSERYGGMADAFQHVLNVLTPHEEDYLEEDDEIK